MLTLSFSIKIKIKNFGTNSLLKSIVQYLKSNIANKDNDHLKAWDEVDSSTKAHDNVNVAARGAKAIEVNVIESDEVRNGGFTDIIMSQFGENDKRQFLKIDIIEGDVGENKWKEFEP